MVKLGLSINKTQTRNRKQFEICCIVLWEFYFYDLGHLASSLQKAILVAIKYLPIYISSRKEKLKMIKYLFGYKSLGKRFERMAKVKSHSKGNF